MRTWRQQRDNEIAFPECRISRAFASPGDAPARSGNGRECHLPAIKKALNAAIDYADNFRSHKSQSDYRRLA
jgi:hypothetical protein